MKIINHKKIIISLAAFCIFYNIYSCAAIRAPSGGLKDIVPPVLLYSLPKSGSVNFKGENIELFFSEYLSEKSIENAKNDAISRALQAGAIKDTIKIIELEEIPLSYLPSGSVRIHAKAVGDIF